MHQILIVDEEEHLLWALEKNLLPDRDDIKVITAHSGEAGLELLHREAIDVLICDIKMPGKVDGFQLILRAKEVAPDARVVIMTAFGTNRIQNLAERIGITHYVEKPFNISELRNVVLELLNTKEGFQGVLSELELTDIIQMLCLAKRTALLHLKHRDHRGKIFFERGEVTHAEFNDLSGDEAVYEMLALRQGDIYMQSDFHNTRHTIHVGWQDLLLEGVRRADEDRATPEELGGGSTRASLAERSDPLSGLDGDELAAEGKAHVFEDSGEITLGMPPRLVGQVVDEDRELGDEGSGSFFTDEELAEIESAGRELSGTANGFDRLLDRRAREIIERAERQAAAQPAERTESRAFTPTTTGEERAQPKLGRPTDSSDFPAQSMQHTPPPQQPQQQPQPLGLSEHSGASIQRLSSMQPALPSREEPAFPAQSARVIAQELPGRPSASLPVVHTGITPGVAPPSSTRVSASWMPPHASGRHTSPTLVLQAPGILSARALLQEFARECSGVTITGLFSFEDGLALDFHVGHESRYEEDVLSAFFRDVAACAEQASSSLSVGGGFEELQIALEREIIMLRRISQTPYVHIAVMHKNVRLGIAIVLMRRYGDRLAACFNR